ncbi:MAG: hypothetical protein CUN51_02175 [Candidatus Thermofonsia Clade 1 bacterium]|uniref:Uncharacterized protein n=1 Tax=Candidatus Thermofonsia Clade 1 bacterium TaxID=2364210 RepID=A0A2M8P2I7_9CHLR|nr:MAG: hypothetical protein CUN51_02175 [Candidatus Thermofonsia Clade 1 bacterium]
MLEVRSAAELRAALRNAPPHSLISLAAGEYGGLFIFDKPLTLRGLGRQTVLWRQAAPVVYVRAPEVHFEHVGIERTVQAGVTVLHQAGCAPSGVDSMQLTEETLINLGELLPNAPLSLPLRLSVNARTELTVTGLHGARFEPSVLPTGGTHWVVLSIEGQSLQRGAVLLGEVTVREGDQVRHIWLSGTVLDQTPPEKLLCLAVKKHRLYPPLRGMLLSSAHFAALGIPNLPEGDYCFVQGDPSGALFLFLPQTPPLPIKLNNVPLERGVRRLLHEHDQLSIGDLTLQVVQAAEAPDLELPATLRFAPFIDRVPEPVPLVLQTLKTGWKGEIVASAPYLSVMPEGQFRVPPNRMHTWQVSLNEKALNLPNAEYFLSGGILVVGSGQVYSVDVQLSIQRPEVSLHVQPLDLGQVEIGWQAERTLELAITNFGRSAWSGEVYATRSWLHVLSPMPVRGSAWAEIGVQVALRLHWEALGESEQLSSGVHEIPNAFIIDGRGAFPDIAVPARLEVLPPCGHLRLLTDSVRFDEVERNLDLPSAFIEVRNEGAADWYGTLRAERGWVQIVEAYEAELSGEISAPTLRVPPLQTARIRLELLDIPESIPVEEPVALDEVLIESDPRSAPFKASVPISMILVERPPFMAAQTVSFPPFVHGEPPSEAILRLYNRGPSVWRGTVQRHAAWLAVPKEVFECAIGKTLEIPIGLHERQIGALPLGVSRHEAALSLSNVREPVPIAVQLDIREVPRAPILETPLLNFGVVNPLHAEPAFETVRLLNAAPKAWHGTVRLTADWLSFETARRAFDLQVPPASIVEFKVLVNAQALALPSDVHTLQEALIIEGADETFTIAAQIALPELVPQLSLTPAHLTLSSLKPVKLKLTNRGEREWTLNLSSPPWVALSLSEVTLEPKETQSVEVRLVAEEIAFAWQEPRGVIISSTGREWAVAVEVTEGALKAAKRAKTAPLGAPPLESASVQPPAEPTPSAAENAPAQASAEQSAPPAVTDNTPAESSAAAESTDA